MIYAKEEISEIYDKFFEAQKNQIEIFQLLRAAFVAYVGLSSFQGQMAENAKAYVEEVHMAVLDTVNTALMEFEIRLLTLKRDFETRVDDSGVAILNDTFINNKRDELLAYKKNLQNYDGDAKDAISPINQYIDLPSLPCDDVKLKIDETTKKMKETVEAMSAFHAAHGADLNQFNKLFPLMDKAFQYMGSVLSPKGIQYKRGDAANQKWAQDMSDFRILAYAYAKAADPNFYDTIYVAIVTECGLDMLDALLAEENVDVGKILEWLHKGGDDIGILGDATELAGETKTAVEAIKLYRSGLLFTAIPKDGGVYIKVTTRTGQVLSNAERVAALEKAGVTGAKGSTLTKLFSSEKGLCVWKNGRAYSKLFNSVPIDWEGASNIANQIRSGNFTAEGAVTKLGKTLKNIGRVGKVAGYAGMGITLVTDIVDGFYDERTNSLSGDPDVSGIIGNLAVDGGVIAASAGIGAAAGSVVPVAGTAVGAVAGLAAGVGIEYFGNKKFGEPPKSVLDHAKEGIGDAVKNIGDFFGKVFW